MHILNALWAHKWIFWPSAITAYLVIGTVIGLFVYWKLCRHQYHKHGWRGGSFVEASCWCQNTDIAPLVYMGFISAPVLWPVVIAVLIFYMVVIVPIKVVVGFLRILYEKVEWLAAWDGHTVANAHPEAKPVDKREIGA